MMGLGEPIVFSDEYSYGAWTRALADGVAVSPLAPQLDNWLFLRIFEWAHRGQTDFIVVGRVINSVLCALSAAAVYRLALPWSGLRVAESAVAFLSREHATRRRAACKSAARASGPDVAARCVRVTRRGLHAGVGGGHQDHDASHLLGLSLAAAGVALRQFPLYQDAGLPGPFFPRDGALARQRTQQAAPDQLARAPGPTADLLRIPVSVEDVARTHALRAATPAARRRLPSPVRGSGAHRAAAARLAPAL